MTLSTTTLMLLVLCVILVNGWTDAPNAIATAVGSGAMSYRDAVALATGCNFFGVVLSCLFFPAVAATMEGLVSFSSPRDALAGLCGALLAVIVWAVAAWWFGLPTSESHALLAGLSGSALALGADVSPGGWLAVAAGLVLSLPAGVWAGRAICGGLGHMPHNPVPWQRAGAALTAFLHGVQDGQKFLALLLLARGPGSTPPSPLALPLLTAGVMALGTALGGRRIVEKIGKELAHLTPTQGLAADLATGVVLAVCSALGLPVSTSHAKVAAICGASPHPKPGVVAQLLLVWGLTFPACMGLGYGFALLMV